MEKINFVNNNAPYLSADNLNKIQDNAENAINGVVLYENADGSNETITLSDSVENYRYIELYFKETNNHTGYAKVDNPNGKKASLMCCYSKDESGAIYIYTKNVTISGREITPFMYSFFVIMSDGIQRTFQNVIYITKVVGYK